PPVDRGCQGRARVAVLRRPRGGRRHDGLPLDPDPRPWPRRLLQGVHAQQLGRRRHLRRYRLQSSFALAGVSTESGPAITRYDFTSGALRGTHFTLYANCLLHRGDNHLETLPLAAIASLRVAYERDARRIGWGVALVLVALVVFAVSSPLAELSGAAAADMAAAGGQGVARALYALFRFFLTVANALPFLAFALALG